MKIRNLWEAKAHLGYSAIEPVCVRACSCASVSLNVEVFIHNSCKLFIAFQPLLSKSQHLESNWKYVTSTSYCCKMSSAVDYSNLVTVNVTSTSYCCNMSNVVNFSIVVTGNMLYSYCCNLSNVVTNLT